MRFLAHVAGAGDHPAHETDRGVVVQQVADAVQQRVLAGAAGAYDQDQHSVTPQVFDWADLGGRVTAKATRRAPLFTTRPEIAGTFGVVASTHWLATAVGMSVLERGGNAFDAAAATAFTLQVAEPHLNGPGGDAPIIIHDAKADRQRVVCGQGPAPGQGERPGISPGWGWS